MLVTPPFGASSNIALWRAYSKPPVELVVADLETLNQMEVVHVNYASMKVFGIYMIVLLICAKLVAMGLDKVRVLR